MEELLLEVIPEDPTASSRVVSYMGYRGPFFIGQDEDSSDRVSYLCGSCHQVIAELVWTESIRDIVVVCPKCHSYNGFPTEPKSSFKDTVRVSSGTSYLCGPVYLSPGKLIEGQ
jgi:DNA-directed RNA polymerase subunit RPC12/RpoP